MVIRTIKLTSLFVNTENYRFEPLSSQKEAIDKMIEDQGDKLYSLVDDIVTNGLSPVDLIIVTPNEDSNKYVVLEGNRRITSLKLLNNPTLIDDKYSPLRKKFQKLQKEKPNAISELKNIACAVFETPTEADIWIKRKHSGELNGIGTVTWNAQQKQRFEEKTEGKSSIPLQIITLLKSQEEVSDTIKDSLSKLNITNLQRLMSDPYVREHLGLEINNGILVSSFDYPQSYHQMLIYRCFHRRGGPVCPPDNIHFMLSSRHMGLPLRWKRHPYREIYRHINSHLSSGDIYADNHEKL